MTSLLLLIAFLASVVGAICGIGGGVIIKPVLDAFGVASVAQISFLSGCTVLSMSLYSVGRSLLAKERGVDFQTATPLAIGAALGGVFGKILFSALENGAEDPQRVGGYQAICLAVVTLGALVYTLNKGRITTLRLKNAGVCALVGLLLGAMSAFLGIGGGPINLVFFYFFFSMETKAAAQSSLYVILISQIAGLLTTFAEGNAPQVKPVWLVVMILGGIGGGIAGRAVNKKLTAGQVEKLFAGLILVIMGISVYNAVRYL